MATATMEFEDLHDYTDPNYYLVPNEGTDAWRSLVKGLRINRAAAICSSGEVGLVAILPTVRKELVLIDHSYASLSVAMLKYLMLRELGAKETHRLLTSVEAVTDLKDKVGKLLPKLPKAVQKAYNDKVNLVTAKYSGSGDFLEGQRTHDSYYSERRAIVPGTEKVNRGLVREWDKLPMQAIRKCATKLDKVKFVHGDLSDLVERGPFDLLYLSNAMDHSGRKGAPEWATVIKALSPGGYVIVAHRPNNYYGGKAPFSWTAEGKIEAAGLKLVRSTDSGPKAPMAWAQSLYQVPCPA